MARPSQTSVIDQIKSEALVGKGPSLMEVLTDVRRRLIYSLAALTCLTVLFFFFASQIFDVLVEPYRQAFGRDRAVQLIYTAPQEFFFTQLQLAFFGALIVGFPFLAFQVYKLLAPVLDSVGRLAVIPYLAAAPAFFLLGTLMVYFVILPLTLHFFSGMQTGEISMLVSVSEYLSFAMTLIVAFGIGFQLPVVLTLLGQLELLDVAFLKRGRRYAIVGILVFAAFVSPPDPVSQIGLATPIYLLYELAVVSVALIERRRGPPAGPRS